MTDQPRRPPRPHTSRQRYDEFVEDYRHHRLDATIEAAEKWRALPAGSGAVTSTIGAPSASTAGPGRRREFMREYVRWLWPYRFAIGGVFLLALLVAALEMIEPLFMRYIIDKVLLNESLDTAARLARLNIAGATFLAVVIIGKLLTVSKDYRQRVLNTKVMLSLRRALFDRLLHLPLPKLWEMKTGGIRVVRAFRREMGELLEYMRDRHTVLRKELFAHRRELVLWTSWGLLVAGVNVVIVWYGGYLNIVGDASIGDIMAFQWYTFLLMGPVWNIVNSFSELQRALAAMERVFEVLGMENDKPDKPDAIDAPTAVREITFEGVEFEYRENRPVVRDFSVTVPGGTDIRDFRLRTYRNLLGLVQQDVFLFDGSVRDNIAYARTDATDAEVEDAARRANAHDFIMRLPESYGTFVGERGVKLSGGQQQRLAIARAILADPQLLILDEATSNVDTESEQLIQAAMTGLFKGRTTFVIAHRLSTVRHADLIILMEDGRVIERGTHDELMRARGAYHEMVVRQMESHGDTAEAVLH